MPLRDVYEVLQAVDDDDRELSPVDLGNLRRVVASGDEGSLVAYVLGLRDAARSQIREAIAERGETLAESAARIESQRAQLALERRIRSIVGLDYD